MNNLNLVQLNYYMSITFVYLKLMKPDDL